MQFVESGDLSLADLQACLGYAAQASLQLFAGEHVQEVDVGRLICDLKVLDTGITFVACIDHIGVKVIKGQPRPIALVHLLQGHRSLQVFWVPECQLLLAHAAEACGECLAIYQKDSPHGLEPLVILLPLGLQDALKGVSDGHTLVLARGAEEAAIAVPADIVDEVVVKAVQAVQLLYLAHIPGEHHIAAACAKQQVAGSRVPDNKADSLGEPLQHHHRLCQQGGQPILWDLPYRDCAVL